MKSLHKLVHSLSQSEKRYIKLRINASKSNSELSVYFDEFSKLKEYDIKELEKTFKKPATVLRANFNKLYSTTLKNLRLFHSNSSTEHTLQGSLADVQLLLNKGLLDDAKKLNTRIIELAQEKEIFYILNKAYDSEWQLHNFAGTLTRETAAILQVKMKKFSIQQKEIESISELYRAALVAYNEYYFLNKTESVKNELTEIIQNPLLSNFDDLKTDQSKMAFCEIKAIHYFIQNDQEKHYEIRQQQFDLIFKSSVYKHDNINKILLTGHMCTYLIHKHSIQKLKKYFSFFHNYFQPMVENSSDSIFIEKYYDVYFQSRIYLLKWTGTDADIKDLLDTVQKVVTENVHVNSKLLGITLWNLAELMLLHNRLKEALKWIIEFQNHSKENKLSSLYIESEIGLLLIYWLSNKEDEFKRKLKFIQHKISSNDYILEKEQFIMFEILTLLSKDVDTNKFDVFAKAITISENRLYKIFLFSIISNTNINEARKLFKK